MVAVPQVEDDDEREVAHHIPKSQLVRHHPARASRILELMRDR
jgi:hypothetical protein